LTELDDISFSETTGEAVAFLTAPIVLFLMLLHWISLARGANPWPGITSELLVPG
jgi:hypothetical protein